MGHPKTLDMVAQEALIREASAAFEADGRIAACWLEGSFASGSADAWSDVDLHVVVADAHWDDFLAERIALIARIRPVLGFVESTVPWGTRLVSANVSGPVRLDLFIENLSGLAGAPRREQPLVLFDKAGVADGLSTNWNQAELTRLRLAQLLQGFFFGCAWPVRLSGREEWGTLLMNALGIVYQFLVPAMLIQDDAVNFFRPQYHNERHLGPERRRQINALVERIRDSFDGIANDTLAQEAVARVYQQLIEAIWRELQRACEMHGVSYPEAAELEMREYFRREMGWEIG